jgi:hypothetical protein
MQGRTKVGRVRNDAPPVAHLRQSGVDAAVSGMSRDHDVASREIGAKRETFSTGTDADEPLTVQERLTEPGAVWRINRDGDIDGTACQLVTHALSVIAHEPDFGLRAPGGHGAKERRSERDHELIAHGDDDSGGTWVRRRIGDEAPQRPQ